MPGGPNDDKDLAFNREKWADELKLRQRELDIKEIEAQSKASEQKRLNEQFRAEKAQSKRTSWSSPLVLAVFTAAAAAAGNAFVAVINGNQQRTVEEIKADQNLILEAIKANNDPDKAAANLKFFADTALISNDNRRKEIQKFMETRTPGTGPALPSPNNNQQLPKNSLSLLNESIRSICRFTVNAADLPNQVQRFAPASCFVINDQGYALTSADVFPEVYVGGAPISKTHDYKIEVSFDSSGTSSGKAELISLNRDNGFALIKLRFDGEIKPVRISHEQINIAENVVIVGFSDNTLAVAAGRVNSIDLTSGAVTVTTTAPGSMDGAPMFNEQGEVVGMVVHNDSERIGTIARPIQMAYLLLSMAGSVK